MRRFLALPFSLRLRLASASGDFSAALSLQFLCLSFSEVSDKRRFSQCCLLSFRKPTCDFRLGARNPPTSGSEDVRGLRVQPQGWNKRLREQLPSPVGVLAQSALRPCQQSFDRA
jgi:hypothetical protein